MPHAFAGLWDGSNPGDDLEDGLDAFEEVRASGSDDEFSEFGDDSDLEEVEVSERQWSIRNSLDTEHRLDTDAFLKKTSSSSFSGSEAIDMLQKPYSIDYSLSKHRAEPAIKDNYGLHTEFHVDLFIVVGRPLRPIAYANGFFDNVKVSFHHWSSPYSSKHMHGIDFDLRHRTFRLATACTREAWFIVMQPIVPPLEELLSRQDRIKRRKESSRLSAMQSHHAELLAKYIKKVFTNNGALLGEGIEDSWKLGGPESAQINSDKWYTFQECFMNQWSTFTDQYSQDPFWTVNHPALHAYDYGGNQEISGNPDFLDRLQKLPEQTRLRPENEYPASELSEDDSDSWFDCESNSRLISSSSSPDRPTNSSSSPDRPTSSSSSPDRPTSSSSSPDRPSVSGNYQSSPSSNDTDSGQSEANNDNGPDPDYYAENLRKLYRELRQKWVLDNIDAITYALAVDIHCYDRRRKATCCLLSDRNAVAAMYDNSRAYTFFPLGFHPAYGNFSSPEPPSFLNDHVLTVLRDNMSYQNNGEDILKCGHFQGYSNIKRSIRHAPEDLLATKGIATAALSLPQGEAAISSRAAAKRQKLLKHLEGKQTPDDPLASKPFAREQRQIKRAIHEEEVAFRMEQVLSIRVSRLLDSNRNFTTVLGPLVRLMRFFSFNADSFASVLTSFDLKVFPGVLISYGRVCEFAIDEISKVFKATGSERLPASLCEGVSAIDRLGSYCFTGSPRLLMRSVMNPLKTWDSIMRSAWPYIDPTILSLRGNYQLKLSKWPLDQDNRPILMHIAAIRYHYGVPMAIARRNNVWLLELGRMRLDSPRARCNIVAEVFKTLWIPQTIAFITTQFHRQLPKGARGQPLSDVEQEEQDRLRGIVKQWSESDKPFSWAVYKPVFEQCFARDKSKSYTRNAARQDVVKGLFLACKEEAASNTRAKFASANSTWLSVFYSLVFGSNSGIDEGEWASAFKVAMNDLEVECMPGDGTKTLTYRLVTRLVGELEYRRPIMSPTRNLKRAAIEAHRQIKRPRHSEGRINFGVDIPFRKIPQLVEDGLESLNKTFQRVNQDDRVLKHYELAYQCLGLNLGDPRIDLMLILVLTLASASVTPSLSSGSPTFQEGKRKVPGEFAMALVTKMLWFYAPGVFATDGKRSTGPYSVADMAKKLEHKGVANRILVRIGWVEPKSGNRPDPRTQDLQLRSYEKLMEKRERLLSLRKKPAQFIEHVFGNDPIWVDRCSGIIREDTL